MPTCSDVITSALKLARVVAPGESPDAEEAADGMLCLQALYDHWRTSGMFGRLEDTYLTADDTAEEGKRYLLATGVTLTEPTTIAAEDAEDGVARQPRDLALYEKLTDTGTHSARLYDRTAWVNLLGLVLTDEAPLASRNQMGLAACLAVHGGFAAMFGDTASLNPDVRAMANGFASSLSNKLGTTRDRQAPDFF